MVMVVKYVTASGGYSMQLMIGQFGEYSARYAQSVKELIVRIVHLIDAKNGFQTTLIKRTIMCHQWQSLNHWLYLSPYNREHRSVFRVLTSQPVYLRTSVVVIVGLRIDEGIECVCDTAVPHYHNANRTYR